MGHFDGGSFRDPNARVVHHHGSVYRLLNASAAREWRALEGSRLFARRTEEGTLVRTRQVELSEVGDGVSGEQWTAALEHEVVPFVSYPYEWCFGMLRDAAALQLDLLREALAEDLILKDASPFNVQWRGARPVFIDIASFKKLEPGEAWEGYRQFCQLFLYPLMLQAYKGIPFQPRLRGSIDGLEPAEMARSMSLSDRLRPGVLAHVVLQAKLQARYGDTDRDLKSELRKGGFDKRLIDANLAQLARLIERLSWRPRRSTWSDYDLRHGYSAEDRAAKEAFVRGVLAARRRALVWDLGCNTGAFSRMAAESSEYVVAMDADQLAVERLYRELREEGHRGILPLVMDVAQPSPALGWRGRERQALLERPRPQLVLALALVHHLAIGANVPLDELVDLLAALAPETVVEFPDREDAMVRKLLLHKRETHPGYEREAFEACVERRFELVERLALASGTRTLYHLRAKTGASAA